MAQEESRMTVSPIPKEAQLRPTLDRLMLGDNQFFGVNHMSEEKARAQALRFQDTSTIVGVLEDALADGIGTFMCTTHDRVAEICDHARQNVSGLGQMSLVPCLPYAHKYANAMAEHGMVGAVRRFLPDEGFLDAAMRGGRSLAKKDIEGVITLLVDAEMTMFRGLRTPAIFLQNVVVDFMLGLGFHSAFRIFADHVRDRYGAEPGFITMNLPMLLNALDSVGIENPLVCSNINKIGFRMSGGLAGYEEALRRRNFRAVAMSIFASGAIPAQDAMEWICAQPNIESIVFGASSRSHIRHTRDLAAKYWA
jgi:hypothetical protein